MKVDRSAALSWILIFVILAEFRIQQEAAGVRVLLFGRILELTHFSLSLAAAELLIS